jgi:hypothetical protein
MPEAHEQLEHAEHAEHAAGSNKKIALVIAIIALFLAFSETLGKSAQTAALSFNVEASNLWAFYQAKTIRQTSLQAAAELLKFERMKVDGPNDALKTSMSQRIDTWEKTVARYDSEPREREVRKEVNLNPPYGEGRRELMALALAAEAKRDTALSRYHNYEIASAAFQIGIVLCSAAVITSMVILAWLAGGVAILGCFFMAIGLWAPNLLHLSGH